VAEAAAADEPAPPGPFERDTAVSQDGPRGAEMCFDATVSPDWRAGRGPHGGYLAAMLMRALVAAVDDPARAPRSLTVHYARAPEAAPVRIRTVLERQGRSLSTLSARMEQDGKLIALALSAFSVAWDGPEIAELPMPAVNPPDAARVAGGARRFGAPPFTDHILMQPRVGGAPFTGPSRPMQFGAWLGLAEPRPIDAISLAFFTDALIPAPFMRMETFAPAPTVDLTIHFRVALPLRLDPDPHELCFAQVRAGLIHDGFFEEDEVIWAADGTVLAHSRQLAILLPAATA
jgi:acyl-coenzyme A thioesterase PaaI-like protein